MSSLNKAILIGNLIKDPEIKSFSNGGKIANFSLATSQKWKDAATGERKERSEFHRISILSEPLVKLCENYLKKGSKIYIEGQIETRSWDDKTTGTKKYSTEIVLRPYRGEIVMLGETKGQSQPEAETHKGFDQQGNGPAASDIDDPIPF